MKTKGWVWSITAGVAIAAALVWAFRPRPIEVEAARAEVARFEATVDEDGKTRVADRYVVSAPLAGRVARLSLREGDAVAAGTVVATLTPVPSPLLDERSLRETSARVEGAQARLQRAAVRIERARVGVEQARVELQRSEQLARDGFIAPTKLDSDRLAAQAAARELDTAVQERHVAEHDLQQARAALGAIRPGSGAGRGFEVRSPVAGRILRVLQKSETTVALGAPLLEVGNTEQLEVVAELLTTEALRALPGTPVRIERWGGPDVLEGRVRLVEPAAFTKVSALGVEEQRVNVIIDVTSPREQWRALGDGYRVSVRIVVLAEERALQVPASAVFPRPDADNGGMAAFVIDDDGRARLTAVTLKARNGSSAWIGDGLKAGARVIVYPPATVRDGVRVRQRTV